MDEASIEDAAWRHSGYIYFVLCPLNGMIKVGYSLLDPCGRFEVIRVHSPVPVEKLALIRGSLGVEQDIHAQCSEWWDHSEWFLPNPTLKAIIRDQGLRWDEVLVEDAAMLKRCKIMHRPPKPNLEPIPPPDPEEEENLRRLLNRDPLPDEDSAAIMAGFDPGEDQSSFRKKPKRFADLHAKLDARIAAVKAQRRATGAGESLPGSIQQAAP